MTTRRRWSILTATVLALGAGVAAIVLLREVPQTGVTDVLPAELDAPAPASTAPEEVSGAASPESAAVEPEAPAAPVAAQPAGEGRVYGTVIFPDGAPKGLPITISLNKIDTDSQDVVYPDAPPVRMQAEATGAFEYNEVVWGEYVVFADAPGYTANSTVYVSEKNREYKTALTLAPGGAISGTVVNEAGDPVAGARVFIAGWNIGGQLRDAPPSRVLASQSIADDHGAFLIEHLRLSVSGEPGYRLAVMADGYATLITDYLKAGSSGVVLSVAPGFAVAGQLVQHDSGAPMPDKEIRFARYEFSTDRLAVRTDAEGFFFLSGLSPGAQMVELIDNELVLVPESANVNITSETAENDLVLRAAAGGRITGRVYQKDTGDGLGNVTVRCRLNARGGRPIPTVTRADGTYSFAGLKPGSYEVFFDKPKGYVAADRGRGEERQAIVKIAATTSDMDFEFVRGIRISGRAMTTDGQPLASANVSAWSQKGYGDHVSTEADGNFTLAGFEANSTVRLQASHNEAALLQIQPDDQDLKLTDADVTGVKFIFGPGASMSGIVVDTDGVPQSGVELHASPKDGNGLSGDSGTSGADGSITFAHLGPGEYSIYRVLDNSWGSSSSLNMTVTMPQEGNVTGQKFVIASKGTLTITGHVVDAGRRPIAGAGILLNGDRVSARTDANGFYTVANLNTGSYGIVATAPGFTPSEYVSAYAGDNAVDLVLQGVASIEGQVVSAQSGQPVTQYKIRARLVRSFNYYDQGGGYTDVVDADGRFTLANVQDGVTTIDLLAEGFGGTAATIPAIVGGEARKGVLLRINAEAELSGRVVNQAGQPVAKAKVTAYSEAAPWNPNAGIDTDEDGSFHVKSLSPGPFTLYVEHEDYTPKQENVSVVAGAPNQVKVVLGNGGSMEGIITLNGKPMKGNLYASAMSVANISRHTETDAKGYYRIDGLPTGLMHVNPSISVPDGPFLGKTARIEVQDGMVTQANFDFAFGTGVIEGTVYAEPGVVATGNISIMAYFSSASTTRDYRSVQTDGGKYRIENVPAGDVMMRVNSDSYGDKRVVVSVHEGQHLTQDIVFSGGSLLQVNVAWNETKGDWVQVYVLPGSAIVPDQLSERYIDDLWQDSAGQSSVIRGRARIDGLERGTYTVLVVRGHPRKPGEQQDRYADAQKEVRVVEVDGEQDLAIAVGI